MGYTHYWTRPVEIKKEVFAEIKAEMEKALKELPVVIANGHGDGVFAPEEDAVIFNGAQPKDDHETFYFPQKGSSFELYAKKPFKEDRVFEFCKTARKPYDLAVMVCLLIAKWHLKSEFTVDSDGGTEEWEKGFKGYEMVFGSERSAAIQAYILLSSDGDFKFLKNE